jgi:hypothetical protein
MAEPFRLKPIAVATLVGLALLAFVSVFYCNVCDKSGKCK